MGLVVAPAIIRRESASGSRSDGKTVPFRCGRQLRTRRPTQCHITRPSPIVYAHPPGPPTQVPGFVQAQLGGDAGKVLLAKSPAALTVEMIVNEALFAPPTLGSRPESLVTTSRPSSPTASADIWAPSSTSNVPRTF